MDQKADSKHFKGVRKEHQHRGLGALLIQEAERDAPGTLGVCVVTSDKSFMAGKEIFIKNGYTVAAESGKGAGIVGLPVLCGWMPPSGFRQATSATRDQGNPQCAIIVEIPGHIVICSTVIET